MSLFVYQHIHCMYHYLLDRRREAVTVCVQLLRDHSREMALDTRFYHHIGQSLGPGSISSATSSDSSAATGITTPSVVSTTASAATLRSTASSPSLRSIESVAVAVGRQDGIASPSPGGNVRVVVRVRKFLPRGRTQEPQAERTVDGRILIHDHCRNSTRRTMSHLDGPAHTNDLPQSAQSKSRRSRKAKSSGSRQGYGGQIIHIRQLFLVV